MSSDESQTMNQRPHVLDTEAVIGHVQETDDVVFCQPPAPGVTRYLWGTEDGGLYLMKCGECNYAGNDAARRFEKLQNGRVTMEWRDSSREGVMDAFDEQMREAEGKA